MEEYSTQFVEPTVSEQLFQRELEQYYNLETQWNSKGVFLITKKYPYLEFIFAHPFIVPSPILFCVRVDFTNYNIVPPSIKFIHYCTKQPLKRKEILLNFWQTTSEGQQDLLQGHPDMEPFFCVRGVREYHNNPAHTGDDWLLYREKGEGTLYYLLNILHQHSTPTIIGYGIQMNINLQQINPKV